jgi:hypothetical protein
MADPEGKPQSQDNPQTEQPDRAPRETPWGEKQFEGEIAAGFTKVETSGHGGLWLDNDQRREIPEYLRKHSFGGKGIWWEEDCAWSLPMLYFLSRKEKLVENEDLVLDIAKDTAREWYPDAYKQINRDNNARKVSAEFKDKLNSSPAKETDRSK